MKNIKILTFLIFIITIILYYKLNQNNNNNIVEDKLSMFIFVKADKNIENILLDLEKQIESFKNYIHNVYYSKNNNYLINNKLKLQFDKNHIDYRQLFDSQNISDFNTRVGNLIESSFIENNIYKQKTKKYLLRDFLVRFYKYVNSQVHLFNGLNNTLDTLSPLEDFIIGQEYFSDYKSKHYMLRVEFLDYDSINNFEISGMDSIFKSIIEYNSKTFNSKIFLYNPYENSKENTIIDDFKIKQYIVKVKTIDEMIDTHNDLILSDNVMFIESIYDYYFNVEDDYTYKVNFAISDTIFDINYKDYKESLLFLEEKLIELQRDDLYNDKIISNILFNLVGDGYTQGLYTKYIDSINTNSTYMIDNLNRIFTYELRALFNQLDYTGKEFDIENLPKEIKNHLISDDYFKVRYFIK